MKKDNFANLDVNELQKEVVSSKRELFNLKLSASAMLVKDYSQFKKLRAKIARILTLIKQRASK